MPGGNIRGLIAAVALTLGASGSVLGIGVPLLASASASPVAAAHASPNVYYRGATPDVAKPGVYYRG